MEKLREADEHLLKVYFKSIQGKDFGGLDKDLIKLIIELGQDHDVQKYKDLYSKARNIYIL